MDVLGLVHISTAVLALLLGPVIFLTDKGTSFHRRVGYGYVASMAVLNGSALMIYDLFGGWGPFHWLALMSGATLLVGIVPAVVRKGNWLEAHYKGMCWSYVGLLAAGTAETLTRLMIFVPAVSGAVTGPVFWGLVIGATVTITSAGAYIIQVRRMGFPESKETLTSG